MYLVKLSISKIKNYLFYHTLVNAFPESEKLQNLRK